MRLAIVCYPTHGGSGAVASDLAIGMADAGHDVHVVSYAVPFRLRRFHPGVRIHEVEIASYPLFRYPPYTLGLATKLAEVADEDGDFDIIHAHYAVPNAVSAFLAREIIGGGRTRVVTTLHGTDITLVGADKSFHRVIRFALERSDAVTAVSDYLADRTQRDFAPHVPVEVIPNFVDTELPAPGPERYAREAWAPNGERILMHISNFRPVKRISDVVRVFAEVRRQFPAKLVLVGEGPERLFAQQLVRELELTSEVVFLGQQDDIRGPLACADLLLLPSEQESFGLTALEAMVSRVPVIATTIGGLPEVVTDGEAGRLFPVGEVRGMAAEAVRLLTDEPARQAMGDAGRTRAITHFAREVV
ncbi:MAG: N-acetyl-alpha-D-glucosaminyl L-malate synthase BshA, partial [Acidobacteriota bacterium]|nr:N-acetyl-alpha-D-glucosaminyl L-malate synthase BshA [Acidobacteriota bacterium]